MKLVLRDTKKTINVSEHVFGDSFHESLIHQIVVAYTDNIHKGTRAQKTRAEVKGSGRKPWRQKGSGRARSGSLQSPIWRSGGVTFATKPQYHTKKINKKMYRGAMKSILSELIRQDRLIVVDNIYVEKPKTRLLIQRLKDLTADNVLIITNNIDTNLCLAARNLSRVDVRNVKNIDPVSLITFGKVIMTGDSIKNVEKILS